MNTVRVWAFVSAKGGVGKSTLAFAIAQRAARTGRAVLLDLDFTGTSLADGLRVCAPNFARGADGLLDFRSPADGFLSLAETRARVTARYVDGESAPLGPPYHRHVPFLNDTFTVAGVADTPKLASILWRLENEETPWILPSSALPKDIRVALAWLQGGPATQQELLVALWNHLRRLREDLPALTDVVFDLPPGNFGFTPAVLRLMQVLGDQPDREWAIRPVIVSSEDRNDLTAAVRGFARVIRELPDISGVINRAIGDERWPQRVFGEEFPGMGYERLFHRIDAHRDSLGKIFVEGGLDGERTTEHGVEALYQRGVMP